MRELKEEAKLVAAEDTDELLVPCSPHATGSTATVRVAHAPG